MTTLLEAAEFGHHAPILKKPAGGSLNNHGQEGGQLSGLLWHPCRNIAGYIKKVIDVGDVHMDCNLVVMCFAGFNCVNLFIDISTDALKFKVK